MLQQPIHEFTKPPEPAPPLVDGEVHLWLVILNGNPTPREVAAAGQSLLSEKLMRYAGIDLAPEIRRGEHGKPYAPGLEGLDFNLSHARNHVLLAFARNQPIGVDLERLDRSLAVEALARRFFATTEADAIEKLEAGRQRIRSFLHLWTCKEAVLKATGAGLSFGLGRVVFDLSHGGAPGRLRELAPEAGTATDWCITRLEPAPGFAGALAWNGPPRAIRAFRIHSDARRRFHAVDRDFGLL